MAQYYGIYDWKQFDVLYIATLAAGLPEESRCMRSLNKVKASLNNSLLALIYDRLGALIMGLSGSKKELDTISDKIIYAKEQSKEFEAVIDFETEWIKRNGGENHG